MKEVSVRELRNHLGEYLRRVEAGEQLTITKRGRVIGTVVPTCGRPASEQAMWDLAAKGVISWSGGKPRIPREPLPLQGEGPTVSEMILEDRGERG